MKNKYLFIDRDGTLIVEPKDFQIDSYEKLELMPNVIPALLRLKTAGFRFVLVSNQDGLGTDSFPEKSFLGPHELMLKIFKSQNIEFDAIHVCPHFSEENCFCRKPKTGMLRDYLNAQAMSFEDSYVIGDRDADVILAENIGVKSHKITTDNDWLSIAKNILGKNRFANICRNTKETQVSVSVDLDVSEKITVNTGIGFFDHMLEQLAKHGGFSLDLSITGDLYVDEHHTVEDAAIALGQALKAALGDKYGIARYGFTLPMDDAIARAALDLSGRAYFKFGGKFTREKIGNFPTEMIPHFFRSLAESLGATLHIEVEGENNHHMVEALFKVVGRTLRQAAKKCDEGLPSTKGVL